MNDKRGWDAFQALSAYDRKLMRDRVMYMIKWKRCVFSCFQCPFEKMFHGLCIQAARENEKDALIVKINGWLHECNEIMSTCPKIECSDFCCSVLQQKQAIKIERNNG